MTKIVLDTVSSGYNLGKINANFEKIEDQLNDKVLYRDNTSTPNEPNELEQDLDLNSNRILNLPVPTSPTEPLRKGDITSDETGATVQYVDDSITTAVDEATNTTVPLNIINDLSQGYMFATEAEYKAFTTAFPVGKVVNIREREAAFVVVSGTGTANGYNIIASNEVSQSIGLILSRDMQMINFGVPTGTDDTAALQNAVDVVSTNGGGTVTLSSDTWFVNMEFGNGVNMKDNVHLIGSGDESILKGQDLPDTYTGVHVIAFVDCSNAKISRLKIDASKPSGSVVITQWHGIKWDGDTYNCIVDDVTIVEGQGDGILVAKEAIQTVVPQGGIINNVRVTGFNRQDISLVEGQKFTITNNEGAGVLDIESDASNRTNDNHYVENNEFNKIRISPLTGLGGTKTNNIVTGNRCNELSLWGGDGDIMTDNIIKGPIVLSQSGVVTINGGSCYYFAQNVTNSTSVEHLIVNNLQVESSTELVGFEIKDVINASIRASIKMTAAGSVGFQQNNNSTQATGEIELEGCNIESDSHAIELTVVGLGNTTNKIKGCTIKSTSGRSVSRIGASDMGVVILEDNDIHAQPVIRNCNRLVSRENRFHGVANINYDFNGGDDIIMVDDKYYDTVPSVALGSNTLTGSIYMRNIAGENVIIGSSVFVFTGTTATDVFIDEIVTNSDTPYSGLAASLRAGSKVRTVGSVSKYGRWYNGTIWADLT